ncbi:hypothetical protein GD429_36300 [Burkholderia sp. BE17]|nr:hypothetical protein [Burkholderia sp. BE17]
MQVGFGHEESWEYGQPEYGQPVKGRWRAAVIGASLAAGCPEWHAKAAILPAGGAQRPRAAQCRPSGRCRAPDPAQISNSYYVPGDRSRCRPISRSRAAS